MARLAVIVRGERVSLVAPAREPFVDRWVEMNDPELGMALGAATSTLSPTARVMPPISREQREALYEAHVARELLVFDLWAGDGERCVGEAYLAGIAWPRGGADVTVALYSPDDRGQGLGTEAAALLCAYAFDGLGLNRMSLRFPAENVAATAATERAAPGLGARKVGVERQAEWVFGRHADVAVWEVLRADFPAHPATAELRTPPGEFEG